MERTIYMGNNAPQQTFAKQFWEYQWPPTHFHSLQLGMQFFSPMAMAKFLSVTFADTLKEILRELDNKLTEDDINNIIEEVDEDGSGTLDFDGTP